MGGRNQFYLYYILILSFLLTNTSIAQLSKINEFEKELSREMTDSARIKLLKDLSIAYSSVDPVKKFYYANTYRELAEKTGADSMVADAYLDMGISYGIRSKADSALYYFSLGYHKAWECNYLRGVGRSLVNMGYAYDRLDDDEAALTKYLEALPIFKKIKSEHGINQCYTNIGALYFDLGQYTLARSYFAEALASYTEYEDEKGTSWALYNMGNVSMALGDFPAARDYFDKSLAIRQKKGDLAGIASTSGALGDLEIKEGNIDQGLKYFQMASEHNATIQDNFHQSTVLISIANANLLKGNFDEAKSKALQALTMAREMKSQKATADVLHSLVRIFKASGAYREALEYQTELIAVEDSLRAESKVNEVMLAEFNRMDERNQNLTKDNEIITSQNLSYLKTIVITSLILVLVILLLIVLYKRNIEKKASNTLLERQKRDIEQVLDELALLNEKLNEQMLLVESQNAKLSQLNKVKNKLFSILSHDLRAPLGTIQMLLSMYREGKVAEDELNPLLFKLEDTVYSSSIFLDNLLEWSKNQLDGFLVNSTTVSIKSLVKRNVELVRSQASLKEISVQSFVDEDFYINADPDMIKVAIRNLLSNSIKFCSPGDSISFRAQRVDSEVILSISDTGPGITDEQKGNMFSLESATTEGTFGEKGQRLGLILCKEMVVQNNGSIDFESEVGVGTIFRITLPAA